MFAGWIECTGSQGSICEITMSESTTVGAIFEIATYILTVGKAGTEQGTVTSLPAGISCGAQCSTQFNDGTEVRLTAEASSGATFLGWGGVCGGMAHVW